MQWVVDGLTRLSDITYQKDKWLHPSDAYVSCLEEDKCLVFLDSGLHNSLTKEQTAFSSEIDANLKHLWVLCDDLEAERVKFQLNTLTEEYIDSEPLVEIRKLAKEILGDLKRENLPALN